MWLELNKRGGHLPRGTDRAVRRRSVRSVKKTSGRAVRRASAHVARKTPSGANSCRRNSFVARMVVGMAVVFGLAGVVFLVGLFPVVEFAGGGVILQLFLVRRTIFWSPLEELLGVHW